MHSADGWREVLEPVVSGYRERKPRRSFPADAAFSSPEVSGFLKTEGFLYAIRRPANRVPRKCIAHLLTRLLGRPPNHVGRTCASFSYRAKSWDKGRRVMAEVAWHPGELFPRVGLDPLRDSSVTNLNRPAERGVAFYTHRGTAEQHIKEGENANDWTRWTCPRRWSSGR